MITVNLKDLCYLCKENIFIEITEEMLSAAIDTLTEAQQRRLKLYYFDGMRYS